MSDKTKLYENKPTQFYSDSDAKTQMYDSGDFEHNLEIGDKINLNHSKYTILSIISKDSGEAIIYKIEDSKGKVFALKMYFEFRSEADEPNSESLRRILKITDSDILKLHNFGIGKDKFEGKYCFEISDFAEGGDLLSVPNFEEKFTVNFIKTKVIPQIFKGIQTLHLNKIFHCDLKPQNVFFRDSKCTNLVIGDYGSAKTFDFENGKDSRKTSTVKGTDFYLPPEQARGFISEKNDYYSFGMILLHLIYPEKVCQKDDFLRLNRQKLREIIENQFENKPIIEFNESKEWLNNLIAGLTLNHVSNRWGEQEIRKWLNGENPEVQYESNQKTKEISSIDLGDRIIQTEKDLIHFIENDSEWYELLFEDRTGRDLFNKWLISIKDLKAQAELDILIKKNQQHGIEFIKEIILHFFQPYQPIYLKNSTYDFAIAEDLKYETARYFGILISHYFSEDELNLYIFKYKLAFEKCQNHSHYREIWTVLKNANKKVNLGAKSVFPNDNFSAWLSATILSLIGKKESSIHVDYEGVTHEGIVYTISENLVGNYFIDRGDDIRIDDSERRFFEFPNYPAQVEENGTLHFDAEEMYQITLDNIKTKLNISKKLYFVDFEKFKTELANANYLMLKNSLPKGEIIVKITDTETII